MAPAFLHYVPCVHIEPLVKPKMIRQWLRPLAIADKENYTVIVANFVMRYSIRKNLEFCQILIFRPAYHQPHKIRKQENIYHSLVCR